MFETYFPKKNWKVTCLARLKLFACKHILSISEEYCPVKISLAPELPTSDLSIFVNIYDREIWPQTFFMYVKWNPMTVNLEFITFLMSKYDFFFNLILCVYFFKYTILICISTLISILIIAVFCLSVRKKNVVLRKHEIRYIKNGWTCRFIQGLPTSFYNNTHVFSLG